MIIVMCIFLDFWEECAGQNYIGAGMLQCTYENQKTGHETWIYVPMVGIPNVIS